MRQRLCVLVLSCFSLAHPAAAHATPQEDLLTMAFYTTFIAERFMPSCDQAGVSLRENLTRATHLRAQLVDIAVQTFPEPHAEALLTTVRERGKRMADELAAKLMLVVNAPASKPEYVQMLCAIEVRSQLQQLLVMSEAFGSPQKLFEKGLVIQGR